MAYSQLVSKAHGRPVKSKARFRGNGEVFLDFTFHVWGLRPRSTGSLRLAYLNPKYLATALKRNRCRLEKVGMTSLGPEWLLSI